MNDEMERIATLNRRKEALEAEITEAAGEKMSELETVKAELEEAEREFRREAYDPVQAGKEAAARMTVTADSIAFR